MSYRKSHFCQYISNTYHKGWVSSEDEDSRIIDAIYFTQEDAIEEMEIANAEFGSIQMITFVDERIFVIPCKDENIYIKPEVIDTDNGTVVAYRMPLGYIERRLIQPTPGNVTVGQLITQLRQYPLDAVVRLVDLDTNVLDNYNEVKHVDGVNNLHDFLVADDGAFESNEDKEEWVKLFGAKSIKDAEQTPLIVFDFIKKVDDSQSS